MIDITLYGKQSSIYQYLKMHILNLADKAGIELGITEVNDTNKFIEESIMSIPTVKMDDEYMSIENKSPNTFINEVNGWVLSKANYGSLKKIYVPIDFTDNSLNAVRYAKDMAEYTAGIISLVHCYYPTATTVNEVSYIDPALEKQRKLKLQNFKEELSNKGFFNSTNTVIIDTEFLTGFPVTELVNLSATQDNILMIMGSSSENKLKKLFGSVSTDVAIKSTCPVLIVPSNAEYQPFNKIVFCSNELEVDANAIEELIKIATPYNADIEIIHVQENDGYQENQLMNLITNYYPKNKVKFNLIRGKSKLEAILNHVDETNGNLIAISRTSKGLIRDFFHKSLTKKLVIKSNTPLFVINK